VYLRLLDLLLEDALERNSVGGKLGDTLAQLFGGHGLLVEVETEVSFVAEVALLLNVKRRGVAGIKLLGDSVLRVVQILEEVGLQKYMSVTNTFACVQQCKEALKVGKAEP
jgi:hypothetical protein